MRYGWQLEAESWRRLAERVNEYQWKRTYLEEDYIQSVPTRPGVYLICASAPLIGQVMERLYNTVYAGQASNLRRRFRTHIYGYGHVAKTKVTFRRLDFWYSELSSSDLNETEQLLLDAFGPSANVKNVVASIGDPVPAGRIQGG